ncbi:MAG: threonine synthase [Sulfurimonas sp.]|nr:threonine synthase [Sulfurimonas sp.]
MKFIQTRGCDENRPQSVSFSEAILSPIASFGGLYVPEKLPELGMDFLNKHLNSSYKELASDMLSRFDIDIEQSVVDEALSLYDNFDDSKNPVPVVKLKDNLFVSELYHGPTRAFKDMALQPFGHILSCVAQQRDENYLILVATSGDTGPAALETFKNRKNIQVVCIYPANGTSDVQRLQMVSEDASNLKVIGIDGNFDDAQSALKNLLSSKSFNKTLKEKNILLSAANSVNFGRIIFQIIYHIHNYLELVRQGSTKMGDNIYIDVPSGNFGNVLGAYYAMKMGLPVEKLIIASNENNILTSLIQTGIYDIGDKELIMTTSPAMDILKSSNVERVLYDLFGAKRTKELMHDLDTKKVYRLTSDELVKLQEIFVADYCSDEEGRGYIKSSFKDGYLMDPHTATCFKAYKSCATKNIDTVIYSTAEWTKFSPVIADALTGEENAQDIKALESISKKAKIEIPLMIKNLFHKTIIHKDIVKKDTIESEILNFL